MTVRVALVTGGNSGIGRAAALALARKGWRSFAGCRDLGKAEGLLAEAKGEGLPLESVRLDVTDADSVQAALARIRAAVGDPDLLVNNAGIGAAAPVEQMDEAAHRRVFETNYFGAIRMIQAVLPAMRARRGGRIVNVSSITGLVPIPNQFAYSASKFALEAATEALAHEVRPFGIRVCNVEPGYVATDLIANARENVLIDRASPYFPMIRRNARYNKAVLPGLPAAAVGEAIADLADDEAPPFRTVLGVDAEGWLRGRGGITVEDWIEMGAIESDADYAARFEALFGIPLVREFAR